jgi:hypothetical protein
MKKQLLTLVLAVTLVSNVYTASAATTTASEVATPAHTQVVEAMPALSNMDMQAAFNDAQSMQFAALDGQEMQATQGAFSWRKLIRAVVAIVVVTVCVAGSGPTLGGTGVVCTVAI